MVTVDPGFGANGYVVLTGYTTWAWATPALPSTHETRARASVVTRMVIVVIPLIA